MITIIYGEDAIKSYEKLIDITEDLKSKQYEIIIQDFQEIEITNLAQEIGSKGLFESSKCFVIKNLLTSSKAGNKDKLFKIIESETNQEIILWENKNVPLTTLKKFPKAKLENFSISPVIFKFLDSIRTDNTKNILQSWKKIQAEKTEPEFVFAMLVRQIKLLIQAKTDATYIKLAPYPARLIKEQSNHFSLNHLLDIYSNLLDIDKKIKTGSSANTIDNLLTNLFQKI